MGRCHTGERVRARAAWRLEREPQLPLRRGSANRELSGGATSWTSGVISKKSEEFAGLTHIHIHTCDMVPPAEPAAPATRYSGMYSGSQSPWKPYGRARGSLRRACSAIVAASSTTRLVVRATSSLRRQRSTPSSSDVAPGRARSAEVCVDMATAICFFTVGCKSPFTLPSSEYARAGFADTCCRAQLIADVPTSVIYLPAALGAATRVTRL
jgi:hypothetical protein